MAASRSESIKSTLAGLVETGNDLWQQGVKRGTEDRLRAALDDVKPQEGKKPLSKEEREKTIKYFVGIARRDQYQAWYTQALPVVRQLMPDRYGEFCEQYRLPKPAKTLDITSYTISDYFDGISVTLAGEPTFNIEARFNDLLQTQVAMLRSASTRIDSILADIRASLQAELLDDEISTGRELLAKGHLRAAGALAGVALEEHLSAVCAAHQVKLLKKNATIGDLNDALKAAGIVDTPEWRGIARLADIRNYCVHLKEREPSKLEVQELLDGVQKAVKTIL